MAGRIISTVYKLIFCIDYGLSRLEESFSIFEDRKTRHVREGGEIVKILGKGARRANGIGSVCSVLEYVQVSARQDDKYWSSAKSASI